MTEPRVIRAKATEVSSEPERALEAVPLTLITEQEFSFSTAVALGVRRRMFVTSTADSRQPRRYCPRRYSFLENALMARERDRL
jgi:hypothetical protein